METSQAQYKELLREMAAHYNSEAKPTERPETGELYATLHDGRWLRVLCEFVDEGQTLFIAPQALMELKSCFAELPTQPKFCACFRLIKVLLLLPVGAPTRRDPASVVLFDVSGPEHVNLNEVVLERLMTACFPPEGHRGHCHLSHVGKDGLLTVQMKGTSLSILHDIMCVVNKRCQITRPAEGENVALIELFRREDSGPELLSVNRVLVHSLKYFAPESFGATGKGGA
ncbi:hypothetical protein HPB48_000898 [Haemaphysalis longicornis]|uniref:Tudor domain-containing protein n=1 Tax=Haemaphysalis longicornis TaxID=44386 RepID=A0A9J6GEE4_HAELO|nr:hypothetical protein HPB48_000898 [Haemaphysalis longicornis]